MTHRPSRASHVVAPADRSGALPQLVSLKELADRFSCDRSTIARRLAAAGVRPYVFNESRTGLKRYSLDEVLAFVREAKGPPAPQLEPNRRD